MMYAVALVVILCSALWWWRYRKYPPGPTGLPVLGYLPWLNPLAPQKTLAELAEKYGPIYGLNLGCIYTVVLSDVKLMRTTFAKESTTGRAPLFLTHGFTKGLGLIGAQGELWKDQRKFLAGFLKLQKFGTKREHFQKTVTLQVQDCIKYLKENPKPKESQQIFYHNIGSAINALTFGFSYERDDKIWKWMLAQQEEGVRVIGVSGILNFFPFLRFLPSSKKVLKFIFDGQVVTHKLYTDIIEERKEKGYQDPPQTVLDAFLIEKTKRDGIPGAENFFHHKQLLHLVSDVFGAGLDTTSVTLNWFCLYMAANPKCQQAAQEELDAVVTDGRCATLDDKPSLPLVEASIMETERIRSVAPLGIPHGTTSDMKIGGYHVPKGTMLIPLIWAVHSSEKFWEEPETFNPKRFLNEEGKVIKSENFIPFQTGKRMCVGEDLANMTTFSFAANILLNFKITLEDTDKLDLDGVVGLTLVPKPHNLIFTPRIL